MEDAANEEWNRLYDQGRYLLRERYRSHTDRIVNEIKFLASQFNEDPQNQAFRQSVEKLLKDLGQDPSGRAQFKPHLVKDIFSVIIPQLFEGIRHVPIPRIEVADPAFDVVSVPLELLFLARARAKLVGCRKPCGRKRQLNAERLRAKHRQLLALGTEEYQ